MELRTEAENMPAPTAHSPVKGYVSQVAVTHSLPPPPYALHQTSQPGGGYPISGLISPPASHSTSSRRTSDDPNDYYGASRQSLSLPSISEALYHEREPPPPSPSSQGQPPPSHFQPVPHSYGPSYPPPPQPVSSRAYAGPPNRPPYAPQDSHGHHMRRSPPPPTPVQTSPSYAEGAHYPPSSADRHQSLPSFRTALPSQAAPYSPHHHGEPARYESDMRAIDRRDYYPPPPPPQTRRHDQYDGYPTAAPTGYANGYPPRPRSPDRYQGAYCRPEPPKPYGRDDMRPPMGMKREFEQPEPPMMFKKRLEHDLSNHDFEMALGELSQCGRDVVKISEDILDTVKHYQRDPDTHGMPAMRYHDAVLGCQRKLEDAFNNVMQRMAKQQQQLEDSNRMKSLDGTGDYDRDHFDNKDQSFHNGPDAKKIRRGRAAPPGRCHSCNRAETPEWRRGPDGARTLCNACGLHYAKLTRRMGGRNAAQQQAAGSSLRPKSTDGTSPM